MQASDPILVPEFLDAAPIEPMPTVRRRLMAIGEVMLCSSIPTQVALGAILTLAGWSPIDESGGLALNFVAILSLADTALLVLFMVWLMREQGESPRALWLGSRPWAREARFGLLIVPAIVFGVGILLNALRLVAPFLRNVPRNPLEQLATNPGEAALLLAVVIIAGGVREELQRAFLLRRFEQ